MKKVILYILILLPWFLNSILTQDTSLYDKIILPKFAPPGYLFGIIWTIIYFIIAYVIFKIIEKNSLNKKLKSIIIINYIFNQSFSIIFFIFNSLFFGYVVSLITFLTSINLFIEIRKINYKLSLSLIPYMIWTLFTTILSVSIYLLNP
ncbi:MAG: tryptophan-rich sensory protein [Bacilli bacterium]